MCQPIREWHSLSTNQKRVLPADHTAVVYGTRVCHGEELVEPGSGDVAPDHTRALQLRLFLQSVRDLSSCLDQSEISID